MAWESLAATAVEGAAGTPRASPPRGRPGVRRTPGITAAAACPGCADHSDTRGENDPSPCPGHRVAHTKRAYLVPQARTQTTHTSRVVTIYMAPTTVITRTARPQTAHTCTSRSAHSNGAYMYLTQRAHKWRIHVPHAARTQMAHTCTHDRHHEDGKDGKGEKRACIDGVQSSCNSFSAPSKSPAVGDAI